MANFELRVEQMNVLGSGAWRTLMLLGGQHCFNGHICRSCSANDTLASWKMIHPEKSGPLDCRGSHHNTWITSSCRFGPLSNGRGHVQ